LPNSTAKVIAALGRACGGEANPGAAAAGGVEGRACGLQPGLKEVLRGRFSVGRRRDLSALHGTQRLGVHASLAS
jgi:hypothetical protein